MNGTVTCISGGKVVDYEVLTKICHQCRYWQTKKPSTEFDLWQEQHVCSINHTGSAGSMEAAGVLSIYQRSIEKNSLRYMKYLADGDSKGFQNVVAANVYDGKIPEKEECVGHVQKKVGARLRSLKTKYKGVILNDGKRLTGPNRLTEKAMNTLQNYYGMVIRGNIGDLYAMKKGVAAILFHCTETLDENGFPNLEERHKYCPPGDTSWCGYQKSKATGDESYKPKINLPSEVSNVMRDIFSHKDLGADSLLKKCLHGLTQNPNEAFNQIIWKRAPKDVYVARNTLEIAVASAVISFNDGSSGILKVLNNLSIESGYFTLLCSEKCDQTRLKHSVIKSGPKFKIRRKQNRATRKGWRDNEHSEEKSYSPGAF